MNLAINFAPTGLLFLMILGFGIWTSRLGKPYNELLFNVHKLIALGAVILTGVRIWQMDPLNEFSGSVIIFLAIAIIFVISMFATGAVMSIQDEVKVIFQWIHRISSVVITVSLAAALFLLQQS